MKKLLFTILSLLITTISFGQLLHTRYYNNRHLQRQVAQGRAKFVQTTVQNPDGSITKEVKDIRKNEVINSQTHKGEEPAGIWKYKYKSIFDGLHHLDDLDYSFDLIYSDTPCTDSIAGLKEYLADNDSLHYQAPKIAAPEPTLMRVLINNIIYPDDARDNNIQGRVLMTITISASGNVKSIVVKKGVHVVLDKEAVRVMRLLKLATPPMLHGKPVPVCFTLPVAFTLE